MTGCGQASLSLKRGFFSIEIFSLNHKGKEITVHLPDEISFFESELRKIVSGYIGRGHVKVKAIFSSDFSHPSLEMLKETKKSWIQKRGCYFYFFIREAQGL